MTARRLAAILLEMWWGYSRLASADEADERPTARHCPHVWYWQILLQKSAYRRRGTAGAVFETIDCHPLDCAGDLRATLLTLATLTQRTKGRTVVAGRPTWQAYGGSAQSLPT